MVKLKQTVPVSVFKLEISELDRSAVILAGGAASRFGGDKGTVELNGKILLNHVIDAVKGIVGEVIVVTNSKERADAYAKIASTKAKFVVDFCESKGPLVGAITGFEAASGEYTVLLPLDCPLVSKEILSLLFDLSAGKSAVVPRWTDQEIEPLQAVYHTKDALVAAKAALAEGQLDMASMVEKMRGVRYISTMVIEQLDPELKTFFNVNTQVDLKKTATLNKNQPTKKKELRKRTKKR
jgi:molybdopterin-guanine dinucleotide biosynthesis protein A